MNNNKYVIIFDKSANASVYFNYKATMREFHKELVAVTAQKSNLREAAEAIRHSLVYCMRTGDRLVIHLDKMSCDFKKDVNFPPDHWPSEQIFEFEFWR